MLYILVFILRIRCWNKFFTKYDFSYQQECKICISRLKWVLWSEVWTYREKIENCKDTFWQCLIHQNMRFTALTRILADVILGVWVSQRLANYEAAHYVALTFILNCPFISPCLGSVNKYIFKSEKITVSSSLFDIWEASSLKQYIMMTNYGRFDWSLFTQAGSWQTQP